MHLHSLYIYIYHWYLLVSFAESPNNSNGARMIVAFYGFQKQ